MSDYITQSRLKEVLNYCPESGEFTWLNSPRNGWVGKVAGSPCTGGYLQIVVDMHPYRSHRLAFLYMCGTWPKSVDHRNGIRTDNRWENLREVSLSVNCKNRSSVPAKSSGLVGVSWRKQSNEWVVQITIEGRRVRKLFKTLLEAAAYRISSANNDHYTERHGRIYHAQ